jgi:hypothetical protein
MKRPNREIDYVEAILAMRTMLSINNTRARELEMNDVVSVEVVDCTCLAKPLAKQKLNT